MDLQLSLNLVVLIMMASYQRQQKAAESFLQESAAPENGGKYSFWRRSYLKRFLENTDIFHANKPIFFRANQIEMDIFHDKMSVKRMFVTNIPLL